jgi:hypothetical protein
MARSVLTYLIVGFLISSGSSRGEVLIKGGLVKASTARYLAILQAGSLTYFKDRATGEILINGTPNPPIVRFIERGKSVTAVASDPTSFRVCSIGKNAVEFAGSVYCGKARADVRIVVRALDHELYITGSAKGFGEFEGIASLGLHVGTTGSHTRVIVPATSGNCFPSNGFKTIHYFEWPIQWEAAMALVQGKHGGLLACAYEPFKRFKNLELAPSGAGWRLMFESENNAPFEGKKDVTSLTWHFRPYSGEWRKGASIYKGWHRKTFKPNIAKEPTWVRNIRAEVHISMDTGTLDALVDAGVDPQQTLLYVSNWRTNHYDVNYPDYTPSEALAPFIRKAHELGFRVMLHVNYFGCDPKMPEYESFKGLQIRHKYSGELLWWEWPRGEFPIKFAYINPASSKWRRLFISKMVDLIKATGADALHLDQTLCIFNDKNGLIGGMNMAEGNLLLHKELKAALPQIAFSGEGLNEVTTIHEAFAQRHVMGIDFASGTFNRTSIRFSHPISAFLFADRTKQYQYLGCGSPTNYQYHTAWRDAYRYWGVLPGYAWPNVQQLKNPSPCVRQVLDEIQTFQRFKLEPSVDGCWPDEVNFPFVSESGEMFAYISRSDGWSLSRLDTTFRPVEDFVRVITGVNQVNLPGTVPGVFCYDSRTISCLDPEKYYVYFSAPRNMEAFHLECSVPVKNDRHELVEKNDFRLETAFVGSSVVFARAQESSVLYGTPILLNKMRSYYRSPGGKQIPLTSEVTEKTGSTVSLIGSGLFMHPPWRGELFGKYEQGKSFGATIASFEIELPKGRAIAFEADCKVDEFANEKSDGVVFRAVAKCDEKEITTDVTALPTSVVPLRLDLTPLAGKRIQIELSATAGPNNNPSHDWGVVEQPRIVVKSINRARCKIIWPRGMTHRLSPGFARIGSKTSEWIILQPGGAVMATSLEPTSVTSTVKLTSLPQCNQAISLANASTSADEDNPIGLDKARSGGIERLAMFSHPPNHGMRLLHYFVHIPKGAKTTISSAVGIRDGSKSNGVKFQIWRNGEIVWSKHVVPRDGWLPVNVDLGESDGEPMMLSLVTDSEGPYYFDWALWADPELIIESNSDK